MQELIKQLTDKVGISEAQAQSAIETISGFLKDKMPAGIGAQVEGFLKGNGNPGDMLGGLKDQIGGFFGK